MLRFRWFYGWLIVGTAFVTLCVNTGIVFYSFGVFLSVLTAHFGWTRAQVSFGFSLVTLFGALYSPFIGRAVDRVGPRPVQLVGGFLMALGFVLLRGVDSLRGFYLIMGLLVSLGSTGLGNLPSNAAVARWFVRGRGRALGISTAGLSMGGVIFVPLTQWLIDAYGWRNSFLVLGVLVALIALPPVALFMRRAPEDLGLRPDGDAPPRPGVPIDFDAELERSWTPAQAMQHRNFWLIAGAFSLTVLGISTTLLHQVAFLRDRGLDPAYASWVLGATAGVGVLGKLGFGFLLERYGHRRIIMWCFGLQALGVLCLLLPTHVVTLAIYVGLYGFAMGGNATLQATIIGECFGRLHYGSIAGRMTPIIVLAQAVGIPLAGAIRDAMGSYVPAFLVIVVGSVLAVACIARLDPHARPPR